MKRTLPRLILAILFLAFVSPVLAAKPRIRTTTATKAAAAIQRGASSSVKFRADRLGVNLRLWGFENVTSVSYELTYTGSGVSQGVIGTITPSGGEENRELLFATCSKNVCKYHTNIQNARLLVTSRLKSGAVYRKLYRLKP